jgi:hypothetical protein
MTEEFESRLRASLRPPTPPEGFAERVMARIESAPPRPAASRVPRLIAALAASALVAVIGVHQWQESRREQGLEARRQLLVALHMTGEKLDIAYEVVNDETR